jgi:hypothetical protein
MGLAILFVVLLLYVLLAYFAARTWQVWHVVLLVFLFLFSFFFFVLASATLKVQQRWRSQYVAATREIENERENNLRLTMGSLGGEEPGETQLRGDVKRMLVDRGRVWRNLRLADLGEGQLVLDASAWSQSGCRPASTQDQDAAAEDDQSDDSTPPAEGPPDEGAAAQAPPAIGLDVNAVVYAFKEAPLGTLPQPLQAILLRQSQGGDEASESDGDGAVGQQLCNVPTFYMGEYKVIAGADANPNAITLAPTMPLSEDQIQQLQDANTTWMLYEVMPVDDHDVFSGLTAEQLSQLIPIGDIDAERYRALIESYDRDREQGNDQDPPERKWMTVKFTQPEAIDVDVEVPADAGQQPLPDSLFDPSGRSLVATLSQGQKTEFQKGDEATFDFATALELISQGKAERVQPIFHRRLRDYAHTFRSLNADLDELSLQMELAQNDLDKLSSSITQLQTQLGFQTQQSEFITSDLEGLNRERQILGQYLGGLEKAWSQLRGELSRLYRTNRELVNGMAAAR